MQLCLEGGRREEGRHSPTSGGCEEEGGQPEGWSHSPALWDTSRWHDLSQQKVRRDCHLAFSVSQCPLSTPCSVAAVMVSHVRNLTDFPTHFTFALAPLFPGLAESSPPPENLPGLALSLSVALPCS